MIVGEIVLIEPGDTIPCDGILIAGKGIKCDESAGLSDAVIKKTYCSCAQLHPDCFMISGSRVTDGTGRYVVIAAPESTTTALDHRNLTSMRCP